MIGAKGVPAAIGGVEKIVDELGARLAERGHSVTVYCRRAYTGAIPPRYRGMSLAWTPAWPGKYTDTLSHAFTSLGHALLRNYDILHIHSLGTAPIVPLAWLAGRRILFHVHGQEWKGGKWGRKARAYFKACEPVALDFAHRVVVNTRASADYYREAYGKETIYIPNAVSIPEVSAPTGILERLGVTPRGYLLFVGRLVPEKGCHYLVEAHRRLGLDIPVVVVGEPAHSGEYERELRARAGSRFLFAGSVFGDALTELYARSLILVNPTERDAVSLVLLEAMAQGACVLTSDIPEMLEGVDGAGYHFRQRDAAHLAEVLGALLAGPDRIEAVRGPARERVRDHYSWGPVTDRFEAVYRELSRA